MKIDGRFWLTKEGESFLGAGRIELLKKIEKTGSIHAAAKEMKMSYKAAWERINSMNKLADEAIIVRQVGGKGGGGTTLTEYAYKLIATYERFNELHRQFIDRFAEAGEDPERLARILSRTFLTTSARNQIPATIEALTIDAINAHITLALSGGGTILSIISAKSAKNMGLELGSEVYAIIKSSDVHIAAEKEALQEKINQLEGVVSDVACDDARVEISLRLNECTQIVAIEEGSCTNSLKAGQKAYAVIAADHIIIGV